jgi:hypothetical protein
MEDTLNVCVMLENFLKVSDGGGSKPGPNYVPGDHRQRNAKAKRANYVGDNARFTGILEEQLIVPRDAMGGATEETDKFLQILNQSVAAGSSESFGVIANRTRCRIATSLFSSIAFNALASSNKLLPCRYVNYFVPNAMPYTVFIAKSRVTMQYTVINL